MQLQSQACHACTVLRLPLQSLRSSSCSLLGRCCHMSNNLSQQTRDQAPGTSAMPHPDQDGHEATFAKSPYQRSVKRQATERSTAPSLVAVLPDELLLKVTFIRLPSSLLHGHPNTIVWTLGRSSPFFPLDVLLKLQVSDV